MVEVSDNVAKDGDDSGDGQEHCGPVCVKQEPT